jgi:hypothetical protein
MRNRITASIFALLFAANAFADVAGSVRIRVENWNWFDAPGFDDRYSFVGALIRAGYTDRLNTTWDYQVEGAVPVLLGLPEDAIAPAPRGQLGFGGTYFAANGEENTISAVLKQAWIRGKFGPATIRAGRFEFIEGTEVVPKEPVLAEIKRTQIAHRLIGNFGFTHVGRSVDGAHLTWQMAPTTHIAAAAFRPTAGAFDVDANGQLDVNMAYAAATRTTSEMDARVFVIGYQDRRDVVKSDNRPLAVRAAEDANVEVTTLGGHYVRLLPVGYGTIDVLLWGALQRGDWGTLDHSANAGDVEIGFRRGRLSYRAGAFRSSGDDNPGDGDHGTFFQVLPTARQYARFPFYNAMNSRDVFAMVSYRMNPRLTLHAEAHKLSLTEGADLWYSGGGAFDDETFGFAGRPSNGRSSLAHVVDLNADWAMTSKTTISAYVALARGDAVPDAVYSGRTAGFVFVELTRRF